MAGLFSSLSMAARSLEAQRAGLDVAGQNIANLNTRGYSRRRLELAEVVNGTGGVEVLGTRALRDFVLDSRVRSAIPDEARHGAIKDTLALVETAIGRASTANWRPTSMPLRRWRSTPPPPSPVTA
jgi:flagellar hook-associated protein 1